MLHWKSGVKPLPEVEIRMDVSFAELLLEAIDRLPPNIVTFRMQRELRAEIEFVSDGPGDRQLQDA